MRLRESIKLDSLIAERLASLVSEPTEKKARALATLIDARNKLDEIANEKEPLDVKEHVWFTGTDSDGRKIRPRRSRGQRRRHNVTTKPSDCTGRVIAQAIRKEFRRDSV